LQYINNFDRQELKDILAAVLVLTAAFTIIYYRDIVFPRTVIGYLILFGFALLTVLTAFLMHEMAHRYVARRLGGFGRFRIWVMGALLALITSILGILFAAPGAVYVSGIYSAETNGKVSLAGPGTNMILAGIFYVLYLVVSPFTEFAFLLGFVGALNSWYAVFNLLPIPPLDGYKVLVWDKSIYIMAIAVAILMNIPGLYFGLI
jgi:Zn-dependent protease